METPKNFLFTDDHEWLLTEDSGKNAVIGISDYAQHKLGDITFVELPEEGRTFTAGDVLATVESVKAASDIFAPVSGKVIEVNTQLESAPETVNVSPYDEGWIAKLEIGSPEETEDLMNASDYDEYIKGLE